MLSLSDWIVASLWPTRVLFLFLVYFATSLKCVRRQFLYLLSPSARKNLHGVHNDHHDFPALKQHEEHHAPETEAPVEILKDDEGTEANVASSIALSQVRILFSYPRHSIKQTCLLVRKATCPMLLPQYV